MAGHAHKRTKVSVIYQRDHEMHNMIWLPGKYCQGKGLLAQAGPLIASQGRKPLILWESFLRDLYDDATIRFSKSLFNE